jgi:hypothetical protein
MFIENSSNIDKTGSSFEDSEGSEGECGRMEGIDKAKRV